MRRSSFTCVVFALVSVGSLARALYGGAETAVDEGETATYFDWRGHHGSGSCSGVLVDRRAVLTAAHCVRSVRFGEHRVAAVRIGNPRGTTERVAVHEIRVHPEFDPAHPERGFDVAVLLLRGPTVRTALARLADEADDPSVQGTRLRIQGFGLTPRGRALVRSRALRNVSLELLSPFHCFSGDVERMARTRFCAAAPDAGVCPGDSGSGATVVIDGAEVVVGVVSLAIDAGTCSDTATVLTRVSAMRPWLATQLVP